MFLHLHSVHVESALVPFLLQDHVIGRSDGLIRPGLVHLAEWVVTRCCCKEGNPVIIQKSTYAFTGCHGEVIFTTSCVNSPGKTQER